MKITPHYLEDLEEAETYLQVKDGLERLEKHVRATGGDAEMLYLIEYLLEENEWWANPKFVAEAQNSHLTLAS